MAGIPRTPTYETRATGAIYERDALTGVRGYYTLLRDFDYKEYADEDVYVVLIDLDNFRMLNDAFGENRCDGVLARVGKTLQRCFGDKRTFRYGSDEFLIVNAFVDEYSFNDKLDSFNRQLAAIGIDDNPLHMTCSVGYAYGKIPTSEVLHEAIRLADRKMFEAKRLGKARAVSGSLDEDPVLSGHHHHSSTLKSYEVDELTGLANLVFFRNQLERVLRHQRDTAHVDLQKRITLLYFNVQNFKRYNQRFGFDAGDELLLLIGEAIQSAFPGRLASRFSADQFMVVATRETARKGFLSVRNAFRKVHKDTSIWLRAGAYTPQNSDLDVGLNMDRAKMACDSLKGRRDMFYREYDEELQAEILAQRYVLENFDQALRDGWIRPFYQPIVRVASGEVCDMEALSRWVDPERGIISPGEFIPVLEDARLIHRLDLSILTSVCRDYQDITQNEKYKTAEFVPVSVNLSRLDFELCDIVEQVSTIADRYGVPHEYLSIEVTESALSGNQEFLKDEIDRFRSRGFEVWMDDFGSGYSSLNLLKEYDFDLVKVDMAFLRNFDTNELSRVILSGIIGMAKELGLKTLMEGVETEEQYEFLRSIGCGRAQGWHFGRPSSIRDPFAALERGDYPPAEPLAMREFYEDVGRMNLMRPNPTPPIDGHYVPGDIPAAIVERVHGQWRFLSVTDTYQLFLESGGIASVEHGKELLWGGRAEFERLRDSIQEAVDTKDWVIADLEDLGTRCSFVTKCIAQNEAEDAIAAIVIVLGSYRAGLQQTSARAR